MKDEDYHSGFPHSRELRQTLEDALVALLQEEPSTEDLDVISGYIDLYREDVGQAVIEALSKAVEYEYEQLGSILPDFESESSLKEHMSILKKLAPIGKVSELTVSLAESRV